VTSGLALIDKPEGWTSHDVVAKVRRLAGTRKVGHAGTLDPMATGLLLLGIDSGTKLLTFLVGADKTYYATIRLGASTGTDDREGDFVSFAASGSMESVDAANLEAEMTNLRGDILQAPSAVSAIKVDGERAYARVRAGENVELPKRPVTITRFEVMGEPRPIVENGHEYLDVDVVVDCSSGTYIRALARDLGEALGVGGHLTALRRTRIGSYSVDDAQALDQLVQPGADPLRVLDLAASARAEFTVRELSDQEVIDLVHGKRIPLGSIARDSAHEPIAALAPSGKLIAMLERSSNQLKSLVVFAGESHA
jgi:tRNA pseudouridine55 synthase